MGWNVTVSYVTCVNIHLDIPILQYEDNCTVLYYTVLIQNELFLARILNSIWPSETLTFCNLCKGDMMRTFYYNKTGFMSESKAPKKTLLRVRR